jgi:hypothetical protein
MPNALSGWLLRVERDDAHAAGSAPGVDPSIRPALDERRHGRDALRVCDRAYGRCAFNRHFDAISRRYVTDVMTERRLTERARLAAPGENGHQDHHHANPANPRDC